MRNREKDMFTSLSNPTNTVNLEKISTYDLSRFIKLCQPFMDAAKKINSKALYPERVDNVFVKNPKPKVTIAKKITDKMVDEIKRSDLCNAELGKKLGLNPSTVYEIRQKISKTTKRINRIQ
jgi:hypothetical protein